MAKPLIHLTIVTQDKELVSTEIDSITAPTEEGEVTILPNHVPLFSKLKPGELIYRNGADTNSMVISKGFIDKGPDNKLMVIVDSAVHAREISLEKAQAAVKAAQESMSQNINQHEMMMAEASLRQALLEIKVAQKTKRGTRV